MMFGLLIFYSSKLKCTLDQSPFYIQTIGFIIKAISKGSVETNGYFCLFKKIFLFFWCNSLQMMGWIEKATVFGRSCHLRVEESIPRAKGLTLLVSL